MASDTRSLGRIATSIAVTLMGKHKPIFDPSTDCGDYVVAVGCHDLHTTGKKMEKKKYYSHSTRPGRLQEITMERMMAKYGGAEVLRRAVSGMLPKNRLRDIRLARLKGTCPGRARARRAVWSNGYSFRGPRPSLQEEHHPAQRAYCEGGRDAGYGRRQGAQGCQ